MYLDPTGARSSPFTLFTGDLNLGEDGDGSVREADCESMGNVDDTTVELLDAVPGLSRCVPEGPRLTSPAPSPHVELDFIYHGSRLVCLETEVIQQADPPSDHLAVLPRFQLS